MQRTNLQSLMQDLLELGLTNVKGVLWNLTAAELVEESLKNGEGQLTDTGALMVRTGKFTGRSPKDRYIVKDDITKDKVWWGDINISYDADKFDALFARMTEFVADKVLYVRDSFVGADPEHTMKVRVIDTQAAVSYTHLTLPTTSRV